MDIIYRDKPAHNVQPNLGLALSNVLHISKETGIKSQYVGLLGVCEKGNLLLLGLRRVNIALHIFTFNYTY